MGKHSADNWFILSDGNVNEEIGVATEVYKMLVPLQIRKSMALDSTRGILDKNFSNLDKHDIYITPL